MILTNRGALKCRAIRRRDDRAAWNWEEFLKVKGTPWEPVPGQPGMEIRIRIEDGMRDLPVEEGLQGRGGKRWPEETANGRGQGTRPYKAGTAARDSQGWDRVHRYWPSQGT